MLRFEPPKDHGILAVEPRDALTADDFRAIGRTIAPYLEEHGKLNGLRVDAPSFRGWDGFGALIRHLKFVRDHHCRIDRVAAVTGNAPLKIAPRIAEHSAHPEIRVFRAPSAPIGAGMAAAATVAPGHALGSTGRATAWPMNSIPR